MIVALDCSAPKRPTNMLNNLTYFLLHWGIIALSLWVASHIFRGIRFADTASLIVSALLLGFANAIVKPVLIILTLPLTLLTFGLFLLVINALMILLVSSLVKGFTVSSFWTAFFASIFIAVLSFLIGSFVFVGSPPYVIQMPSNGRWI
jgi:putative membrane protein